MEYISTRNTTKNFSFNDIFLKGLASDGGLFVPKKIPLYTFQELEKFKQLSYKELAVKIISRFCTDEFKENEIKDLVNNSYNTFRVDNVVKIKKLDKLNLLELFHGPTLAFKDIAMQMIGNMYEQILKKKNLKINVVVATSGDTGAAAISAIKNRKNIKIFVLHPHGKISNVQRKLMTTTGSKNVFNIAVDGNFDDCQKLVKSMFVNTDFSNSIKMSGVNSINWARIIMQIVYYFYCYFQISKNGEKINFSVPTGNFGDVYAGYVAKKMGLPINKLLIATNKNDILKRVIDTGCYKPLKVQHTISPSMDIQVASNFERLIFDVFFGKHEKILKSIDDLNRKGEFQLNDDELKIIKENFCSESLSEEETKKTIKNIYDKYQILIDPHTAVGVGALNNFSFKENTVVLATAHPSKFSEIVENQTGIKPDLPEDLKDILSKREIYENLPNNLNIIQNYIKEKI